MKTKTFNNLLIKYLSFLIPFSAQRKKFRSIMQKKEKMNKASPQKLKNPIIKTSFRKLIDSPNDHIYIPELNIFYKKIAKSACSSTTQILMTYYFDKIDLNEFSKNIGSGGIHISCLNAIPTTNLYPQNELNKIESKKVFKFTFVRNPYKRLLSAYLNKMVEQANRYKKTDFQKKKLTGMPHEYFHAFFQYECLIREKNKKNLSLPYSKEFSPCSFKDFVNYICGLSDEQLDKHFTSQCYESKISTIPYDFIGKVENFNKDMSFILDKINAPKYMYKYLKTRINKTKSKSNLESCYTKELQEKVYKRFKKDFDTFGYEKELPQ